VRESNIDKTNIDKALTGDADLRWQLRQLPRELEPTRDLWPGIAAGIDARRQRPAHRWLFAAAMAASLLLTVGVLTRLVSVQPATTSPDLTAQVVRQEAHAMTREYQAALRELDGGRVPASLAPSMHTLDDSAAKIRQAIAADPDSVFLLQQLHKTYSRRLALTQRAVTG
jgi:hypothetical protein